MEGLTEDELAELTRKYGAGFCRCVETVTAEITVAKVAKYCESRNLEQFSHVTDKTGDRYAYLLGYRKVKSDDGEIRNQAITASFGTFFHFTKSTMDSCLEAIKKLAVHFKEHPVDIAMAVATQEVADVAPEADER